MKQPFLKADLEPLPERHHQENRRLNWFETPRTRWQLRLGLPLLCWRLPSAEKAVYLTFDDGPTPHVTDQILDILQAYRAYASFFCLGQFAERMPESLNRMVQLGHSVGNHTYSHLSGWQSSVRQYLDDIHRCDRVLPKANDGKPRAFRPPFGQLGIIQGWKLLVRRRIVMWDVNSMDYRGDQSSTEIARRVCQFARPGSIVLMHDSADAGPRTIEAMPRILDNLSQRGFRFNAI